MAPPFITTLSFALLLCCFGGPQFGYGVQLQDSTSSSSADSQQLYIIYMRRGAGVGAELGNHTAHCLHLLQKTLGSADRARKSFIYSYEHAINGFSALLSQDHVNTLAAMHGVVQIVPSEIIEAATTNSWDFLGLSLEHSIEIGIRNSTIVGVIDTGVNAEHPAFTDNLIGSIPERWKGTCEGGPGFPATGCNRKLIGVRYYVEGWRASFNRDPLEEINALDRDSAHGTHVSGTAVGLPQNVQGGVVRGGNPFARLATYKALWERSGAEADILKAIDDAIADGVDIINLSIAYPSLLPLYCQAIAIGSFSAMRKNILTVQSAGNAGPAYSSITAIVPWTITVAATTTSSDFLTSIQLRGLDGLFPAFSNLHVDMSILWYDLVPGDSVKQSFASDDDASHCRQSSLHSTQVVGKIVFCKQALNDRYSVSEKINYLRSMQAAGLIIEDDARISSPPSYADYPALLVNSTVGSKISNYIQSSITLPMARILQRRQAYSNAIAAPAVASFSSRGPNNLTLSMLKPDIAAPGVNILAADGRRPLDSLSFMSGTSMAAPHVSAVASLLRAYHGFDAPWSAAALKSALMTTASTVNEQGQAIMIDSGTREANPFDYGSGQMQPLNAINQPGPGLIYDADANEHVRFLCMLLYPEALITDVFLDASRERANCTGYRIPSLISQLNFPSIAIAELQGSTTVTRFLTNVETQGSTYNSSIEAPAGVSVVVSPPRLQFSSSSRRIPYRLILTVDPSSPLPANTPRFGSITWSDELGHHVRSPIVIHSVVASTTSNLQIM